MSDNNKNRKKSNGNDFDWDEYDFITSHKSDTTPPPQRRQRASSSGKRSSQRNSSSAGRRVYSENSNDSKKAAAASAKKKKKKSSKKQLTEKQIKFRKRLRFGIIFAVLILFIVGASVSVGMYAAVSREIKDMNIRSLAVNSTSFIYYTDSAGNTQQLSQIQSDNNRIWVESSQIPQVMKDAIVSIEDERFYKHHGVDIKRTLGATVKYALSKIGIGDANYGGSTITQQVIKNITQENEKTSMRKIKEIMRAIALEQELSKDEIVTLYLNIVYFANSCYGVEAAANTYFAKSASELTLAEAASIAGITQYPSQYDPYANPESNIKRRNTVLAKMYELGYITEDEYNTAAASDLVTNNTYRQNASSVTSYFVDQVMTDVISDLQTEKGYSEDFATQQVYNGGLKIYSTVDVNIQGILEDVYYSTEGFPYTGMGAQSAMYIMDPYTGQVKGLIGGLGEKTDIRGFNRATQSRRQPGSSIKPLSVYGPAVDLGKITEVTKVVDEEITIGSDNWKPKNSYNDFYGEMTVKEALARSSNIPAVKVLDMIGLSTSYGYLQNKFHISTMSEDDKNYSSLSLGGLTTGVSPKDMAAAYSVFVNGGKYIEPYTYTRVEDSTGQVILENTADATQSISAAAAYITSDMLYSVVNSEVGTATAAKLDSGMPTYGKTGTTDDDFDKWFVGFTPYYVCAAWYGFDSPSSISAAGVSGNPCVTVWHDVMERIHENLEIKQLERPTNVIETTVCMSSGMLATSTCNAAAAYFVDGTQPKELCNNWHASGVAYDSSSAGARSSSGTRTTEGTASGSSSSGSSGSSGTSGTTAPNAQPTTGTSGSAGTGSESSGSSSGGSSSGSGSASYYDDIINGMRGGDTSYGSSDYGGSSSYSGSSSYDDYSSGSSSYSGGSSDYSGSSAGESGGDYGSSESGGESYSGGSSDYSGSSSGESGGDYGSSESGGESYSGGGDMPAE